MEIAKLGCNESKSNTSSPSKAKRFLNIREPFHDSSQSSTPLRYIAGFRHQCQSWDIFFGVRSPCLCFLIWIIYWMGVFSCDKVDSATKCKSNCSQLDATFLWRRMIHSCIEVCNLQRVLICIVSLWKDIISNSMEHRLQESIKPCLACLWAQWFLRPSLANSEVWAQGYVSALCFYPSRSPCSRSSWEYRLAIG